MVDLTDKFQRKLWDQSITKAEDAANRGWLNVAETKFVWQMAEEYRMNGEMFEPSRKQFDWMRNIAFELEKEHRYIKQNYERF